MLVEADVHCSYLGNKPLSLGASLYQRLHRSLILTVLGQQLGNLVCRLLQLKSARINDLIAGI